MKGFLCFLLLWTPTLWAQTPFEDALKQGGANRKWALEQLALGILAQENQSAVDWFNLGQVRRAQSQPVLALWAYRQSLFLSPNFEVALRAQAQLEKELKISPQPAPWSLPSWAWGLGLVISFGLIWPVWSKQPLLSGFLVLLSLGAALGLLSPLWPTDPSFMAAESQSLRLGPGAEYPVSGALVKGEVVRAGKQWGNWLLIKRAGEERWVDRRPLLKLGLTSKSG